VRFEVMIITERWIYRQAQKVKVSYICWLLLAAQTQTQTREGGVFDHPLVFTFNFQIVFTDFASFLISLFAMWTP